MPELNVQEWQLLSFFEVEPTLLDPKIPWYYNDAFYEIACDDWKLTFAIQPGYRDVRLVLTHRGVSVYELDAMDVEDIRYLKDVGVERLEIVISREDSVLLQVKPRYQINHKFDGRKGTRIK